MNCELPDVQVGFRKGIQTRDQTANNCRIIKKEREFEKNIYFCFIDYVKSLSKWITTVQFSSVQFNLSVVSDSFRPHALQHTRPPCPSPTPGVHPNPCPCLVCLFYLLKEPAFSFIYLCIVSFSHVYPSFFFFFILCFWTNPVFKVHLISNMLLNEASS